MHHRFWQSLSMQRRRRLRRLSAPHSRPTAEPRARQAPTTAPGRSRERRSEDRQSACLRAYRPPASLHRSLRRRWPPRKARAHQPRPARGRRESRWKAPPLRQLARSFLTCGWPRPGPPAWSSSWQVRHMSPSVCCASVSVCEARPRHSTPFATKSLADYNKSLFPNFFPQPPPASSTA